MGFGNSRKEVFVAGCRPDEADERGLIPCKPTLIDSQGKKWGGERDVLIKISGGKAYIQDDGNTPTDVLNKLQQHLEKNMV